MRLLRRYCRLPWYVHTLVVLHVLVLPLLFGSVFFVKHARAEVLKYGKTPLIPPPLNTKKLRFATITFDKDGWVVVWFNYGMLPDEFPPEMKAAMAMQIRQNGPLGVFQYGWSLRADSVLRRAWYPVQGFTTSPDKVYSAKP